MYSGKQVFNVYVHIQTDLLVVAGDGTGGPGDDSHGRDAACFLRGVALVEDESRTK